MDCKETYNSFIYYIEGDLSHEKIIEFDSHINECSSCSKIFNEIKLTYNIIDNEKDVKINPFLFTRIKQRLENENLSKVSKKYFLYKKALNTVLLSSFIILGIWLGIFMGSINNTDSVNISQTNSEIYYMNDIQQESVEFFLIED